jgi:biotin transport system substrate-specific component
MVPAHPLSHRRRQEHLVNMSVAISPAVRLGAVAPHLTSAAAVIAGGSVVAVLGQVAVPLPFTPVPLSLGTLGVLLVGAALGPGRAAVSMAVLVVAGLVGLPAFAGGTSGWAFASFGYVLGYVPAASLVMAFRGRSAGTGVTRTLLGATAASVAVYVAGVPWLMGFTGSTFAESLELGVLPFLIGDAVKVVAVAGSVPAVAAVARRLRAPKPTTSHDD